MTDTCVKCTKKCYFNERIKSSNGKPFHKSCFHCEDCDIKLAVGKDCEGPDHKVHCKGCYGKKYGCTAAVISHHGPESSSSSSSNNLETPKLAGKKYDAFLTKLEKVKREFPENRCAKYLTREIFNSFNPLQQEYLSRCGKAILLIKKVMLNTAH